MAQETRARIRLALPDGGPGVQVLALWSRSPQRAVGSLTAIWWEAPANPPTPPPTTLITPTVLPHPTPGAGPGRSRDKAGAGCIRAGSSRHTGAREGQPQRRNPIGDQDGVSSAVLHTQPSGPSEAQTWPISSGHSRIPRFATSAMDASEPYPLPGPGGGGEDGGGPPRFLALSRDGWIHDRQ